MTGNLAGMTSECGNMSYVSAHPARDEMIAGIALQGLWSSEGGSDSWAQLGVGAGSDTITNRPGSIVYDPDDPNRWWESGIYNGGGVYETRDGGATFTQLGDVVHVDFVSVDLSDPERRTLLANTHEQRNVFRSADGGATWQNVSAGLPDDIGIALAPLVVDSQVHLLGTWFGSGSGIFRTTDGGETWEQVFDGGISSPPLVAQSDGAIYWLQEGGGSMLRSTDAGVTWEEIPGNIPRTATGIIELPDGRLVTQSDRFLIISSDQGTTWQPYGPPMPYFEPYNAHPAGFTYSPFRNAFYVWHWDCLPNSDNPVPPDAIMALDFDYRVQ